MSGIDWSLAPEGSTHYAPAGRGLSARWFDMSLGEFGHVWHNDKWNEIRYWAGRKDLIARPIAVDNMIDREWLNFKSNRVTQWSGEGLPPVGTVCEALKRLDDTWLKVRVIEHQGSVETAACRVIGDDRLFWSQDFRPIRTPEQIAAEERDAGIQRMLSEFSHTGSLTSFYAVCETLYLAGYRKQADK